MNEHNCPSAPADSTASCPWQQVPPCHLLQTLLKKPFRKRHPLIFWLGLPLLLVSLAGLFKWGVSDFQGLSSDERIAVLRVEGLIMHTRSTLKWMDRIQKDDSIKAVLLRVDSPGGGAAASQELYEAIAQLHKKKPVVAYMGSVAASGGLMVSMAAPVVVANPSTVTGSIGVKMDVPQLQGLMQKLGVGQETLTTGAYKDAGSPFRPMTDKERNYLNGVLQDMHSQFVELVAKNRKLSTEQVQAIADGRIFTGREALKLGLVDYVGGQDVALQHLRTLANLPDSAPLVEQPKENSVLKELLQTVLQLDVNAHARGPEFMYMY